MVDVDALDLEITETQGTRGAGSFDYEIRNPELRGQHFKGRMGLEDDFAQLVLAAEVRGPYDDDEHNIAFSEREVPPARASLALHPPEFNMPQERREQMIRGLAVQAFAAL